MVSVLDGSAPFLEPEQGGEPLDMKDESCRPTEAGPTGLIGPTVQKSWFASETVRTQQVLGQTFSHLRCDSECWRVGRTIAAIDALLEWNASRWLKRGRFEFTWGRSSPPPRES